MLRTRLRKEDGFTLIELMVVVLIIALLAAIALPAFLGQRAKAQDGSAKSNARTMVSAMEACYTEENEYDPCPNMSAGVTRGSQPGEVEVTPSGDTYVIVAHSHTGNSFRVTKHSDARVTRECSDAGTTLGGCEGSSW